MAEGIRRQAFRMLGGAHADRFGVVFWDAQRRTIRVLLSLLEHETMLDWESRVAERLGGTVEVADKDARQWAGLLVARGRFEWM